MKTVSAVAAVAGAVSAPSILHAADAELSEKIIRIVSKAYPETTKSPEVVKAFADLMQKAETPRMEPLSFVTSEGAKNSEAFERYVIVEFSVATNIVGLGVGQKLALTWK